MEFLLFSLFRFCTVQLYTKVEEWNFPLHCLLLISSEGPGDLIHSPQSSQIPLPPDEAQWD